MLHCVFRLFTWETEKIQDPSKVYFFRHTFTNKEYHISILKSTITIVKMRVKKKLLKCCNIVDF